MGEISRFRSRVTWCYGEDERSPKFVDPGATVSISADGNRNAIVWAIATKTWNGPDTKRAVLYAFDATRLGEPIYNSEQKQPTRPRSPGHAYQAMDKTNARIGSRNS